MKLTTLIITCHWWLQQALQLISNEGSCDNITSDDTALEKINSYHLSHSRGWDVIRWILCHFLHYRGLVTMFIKQYYVSSCSLPVIMFTALTIFTASNRSLLARHHVYWPPSCSLPVIMFIARHHVYWPPSGSLPVITFTDRHHVHCAPSCSLPVIMFITRQHVHCPPSCSLPAIMFIAHYQVHYPPSCSLPQYISTDILLSVNINSIY